MTTPTLRGVKGMPDLQPVEAERFRRFEAVAASLLGRAGFREVRTPLLEPLALFQRSVGESSDIVRKEMYTLKDLGERDLALRPEGTAGVVRAVVEHSMVAPGEELPPIRVLAEQLLVNPNTVARAYRELETAGVVTKRRTRGCRAQHGGAR